MKRLLLTVVPAMLSVSHLAAAQGSAVAVPSGARVRLFVVDTVDTASGELRFTYPAGTVVAFDSGALVLRSDSTDEQKTHVVDTLRVSVAHIGSAEAYAGRQRHPLVGASVGLVFGGFLGYVVGDHAYGSVACATVADIQFCARGAPTADTRWKYAGKYGGVSALAGAALGYLIRTDRWSRIDIGRLRLQAGLRP